MFLEEVNTKLENMELTLNQLKEENRFAFLFDTSLSVLFLKELGYPGAARPSFLNGCLIKKKKKSFLRIINFFRGLSKFNENLKFWRQFFEILSIYKPSLGSFAVTHNLWARSVQPFERLLDKNKLR